MTIVVEFVFGYFVAFSVLHAGLLGAATFETQRYARTLVASSVRRTVRSPLAPPISILVPAFNESAGIADSIRSLLALEYPTFELVVINDGSTDETLDRLVEAFDLRPARRPLPPFLSHAPVRGVYVPQSRLPLLVIDKDNAGKADSLNAGINYSRFPIVCAIDADSILEQDALVKTAMPFVDDPRRTVVSGGMVRVANGCRVERGRVVEAGLPRNALAMFQVVEYIRSFFGARTGWSSINGLLIISGAFGLFRKDVVIAAGGYRTDTVGEDIELVVRLHRQLRDQGRPYRVVYLPDPVCWTEAPESARILRRQRRRWHRGSVETLLIHRRMIGNPRYRAVGLLALPALLFFEVLGPVIELTGYIAAAVAFGSGGIQLTTFVLFFAVAVLYGLFLSIGAVALEDATFGRHPGWGELARILGFAVFENLGYRQLVLLWRMEGFWQLIRKGEWGAMERKGLSTLQPPEIESEVGLR